MATCPGCIGRGTGARCFVCGAGIPADLQRTPNSAPEWSPGCDDCVNGRHHTHQPTAPPNSTDPRRNVNRTIRTAVTALLAAAVTLPLALLAGGGQAGAVGCLTPAQLHTAALRGDTATAHLAVNWQAGTADFWTSAPLCQAMFGTAAQNAYQVGARPVPGHGAALWPQQRAAFTAPQRLTGGGHHPFKIPVVTDGDCYQGDVSVEDHPAGWPLLQPRPGTPQPRTRYFVPGAPGERVGGGRRCFPPPSVSGAVPCPKCVGTPRLAVTVTNRAPYARVQVQANVNGHRVALVTIAAGRSAVIRLPVGDGGKWSLFWQAGYGRWTPLARLTPDRTVLCPPYPQIAVTFTCNCGQSTTGTVLDFNHGRYDQAITVVAGARRWTFHSRAGAATATQAVDWPRGTPLTVTVQNSLGGHPVGPPVRAATVTVT